MDGASRAPREVSRLLRPQNGVKKTHGFYMAGKNIYNECPLKIDGKLTNVPWKLMVGRCVYCMSSWNSPFLGDICSLLGVYHSTGSILGFLSLWGRTSSPTAGKKYETYWNLKLVGGWTKLGMAIPPLIGNPYSGYINPNYWVDDHPK